MSVGVSYEKASLPAWRYDGGGAEMTNPALAAQTKNVLIVDDDHLICEQLKKELRRNFFHVVTASNGTEALRTNLCDTDIVLLDVKLPDISGLEILSQIKHEHPDCEIIVITGYGTQEIAIQALRRGAIDYIEKPIDPEVMTAALGRAMEKIRERAELAYKHVILIIDDDEELLRLLSRFIKREGFDVLAASCGEDGLAVLEKSKVDVVVSDIKMQGLGGIDVLETVKRMYQDIEVIMVTGFGEQELAVHCLRAGASDYLQKPIHLDELIFSINRAIERINLRRDRLYRNRELKLTSEIVSKMNEELERLIDDRTRALSQTQAQLFQTSKLATLGEMAAGLAHEMNQPLSGIALVCKNLARLQDRNLLTQAEVNAGLADIGKSVTRMAKVITHIRTFARQDTFRFIEVDVNESIESALSLLSEQLRLQQIEVRKALAPALHKVVGEPYQIEQVMINLITNARDALDEKEKVQGTFPKQLIIASGLERRFSTAMVAIAVSDNGIGMNTEVRTKIFEPFFTTKEIGKATGLGMSISYGIIHAHEGEIEVESQAGIGTTIKVFLPLPKSALGGDHDIDTGD